MGFGDFFERKTKVDTVDLLSPEQQRLLTALTGISERYAPEVSGYFADVMRGKTGLSPEAIEQFYQQGVLSPALYEYETYTKPQIEEQFGSRYHSSARTKTLSRAFSDLMSNMAQTRANLQYQGLLQNLQARMQAAGALQGQLYQPLSVKTKDFIVSQQASPFDMLTQGLGAISSVAGSIGMLGLGFGGKPGDTDTTSRSTMPRR